MSEAAQLALIGSIAPTLAVLASIFVVLIKDRARREELKVQKAILEAQNVKLVVQDKKLDHIVVLTNSTLTAANNLVIALKKQVSDLGGDPEKEVKKAEVKKTEKEKEEKK